MKIGIDLNIPLEEEEEEVLDLNQDVVKDEDKLQQNDPVHKEHDDCRFDLNVHAEEKKVTDEPGTLVHYRENI